MVLVESALLVASLLVLGKSADIVVEKAAKISRYFNISQVVIGFLFISIATTLPELSVSVVSSFAGHPNIASGNALGSVIFNVLVILGIGALFGGLSAKKEEFASISNVLLGTMAIAVYLFLRTYLTSSPLGLFDGLLLLAISIIYAFILIKSKRVEQEGEKVSKNEMLRSLFIFILALVILPLSADVAVQNATALAGIFNLTQGFIGSTIIACGTSLPELSVMLQSVRRKQYSLTVGNIIGANLFDMTSILGVAAVISPLVLDLRLFVVSLVFVLIACMFLLYTLTIRKKISKNWGVLFVLTYVIYLVIIFLIQPTRL